MLGWTGPVSAGMILECAMQATRIELLQQSPVFGGVRPEILAFLLEVCPVVTIAAGAYFFREDDPGDAMFVIEAGKASALKTWQGQEFVLKTLGEGDCFGEMAVIDHCARSASVRAIEDCSAIRISSTDLYHVYAKDLKQFALIQMNMGREVCRRLREADRRLFALAMEEGKDAGHGSRVD